MLSEKIRNLFNVPAANASANTTMAEVLGNKNDTHLASSVVGLSRLMDDHMHKSQFVYPKNAAAVSVVAGTAANQLGAFTEIVPVSTITGLFDLHWIQYSDASAKDEYYFKFYVGASGAESLLFEDTSTKEANQASTSDSKVQHIPIAANSRITVKASTVGGGNDTVKIKVKGHVY